MRKVCETIRDGMIVSSVSTENIDPEQLNLRNAAQAAIDALQTIQGAALTTEAAQIAAIKEEAQILEKLIRYIKRRID